MIREIEAETRDDVLGKKAILCQHPHDRPKAPIIRSPAPRFHAIEAQVRRALEIAYHLARIAYRQAREDLWRGRTAEFPEGCFPPALSYVGLKI